VGNFLLRVGELPDKIAFTEYSVGHLERRAPGPRIKLIRTLDRRSESQMALPEQHQTYGLKNIDNLGISALMCRPGVIPLTLRLAPCAPQSAWSLNRRHNPRRINHH
jgi:hypothetical protein